VGKQPLIALLATLLVASVARAAEPMRGPVEVAFQDCDTDPIGEPSFLQALGLELDQDLDKYSPRPGAEASSPKIDVKFRCDGLALIRIQLEGNSSQRRVRFSDVARAERARALALVVAELYRSGSQGNPPPAEGSDKAFPESGDTASAAKPPEKPAAPEVSAQASAPPPGLPRASSNGSANAPPDAGVDAQEHGARSKTRPRVRVAATLRTSLGEVGTHYGGSLGLDFHLFRLAAETLFSRETRSRGAISSGVAAVRVARGLTFAHAGPFELEATLSAAIGATWAVGHSDVVGTVVRDVLMPYGDARLGLLTVVHADSELEPEMELYAGRAAGILARADGESTQATGGWFAGVEAGISF
jgi:hypothetical protein